MTPTQKQRFEAIRNRYDGPTSPPAENLGSSTNARTEDKKRPAKKGDGVIHKQSAPVPPEPRSETDSLPQRNFPMLESVREPGNQYFLAETFKSTGAYVSLRSSWAPARYSYTTSAGAVVNLGGFDILCGACFQSGIYLTVGAGWRF